MDNPTKGTLLLTSAGFLNPNIAKAVLEIVKDTVSKKVAVVTTATEGKESHRYSKLAKEQLESMGFGKVDFVDLETQGSEMIPDYDVVYVCGGNTFYLLKFARETNFKDTVLKLLDKGGLYIGVSAGTCLVCPSTIIANEIEPDPNDVGIADFTGFHLTDLTIHPHYEEWQEPQAQAFEKKHGVKLTRLTNDQAVLIQGGNYKLIQ